MDILGGFNDISVKAKTITLAGILIGIMLVAVGYAVIQMKAIEDEIHGIASRDIPLTEIVTEATVHQLEQAINFERALRYGEEMATVASAASDFSESVSYFDKLNDRVEHDIKQGEEIAHQAKETLHTQAEIEELGHILLILSQLEVEHKSYAKHAREVFSKLREGKLQGARKLVKIVEKEEDKIDHELEALLRGLEKFTGQATVTAEQHEQYALRTLLVIVIVGIIIGVSMSSNIMTVITHGMRKAIEFSESISSDDLTAENTIMLNNEICCLTHAKKLVQKKLNNIGSRIKSFFTRIRSYRQKVNQCKPGYNLKEQIYEFRIV